MSYDHVAESAPRDNRPRFPQHQSIRGLVLWWIDPVVFQRITGLELLAYGEDGCCSIHSRFADRMVC